MTFAEVSMVRPLGRKPCRNSVVAQVAAVAPLPPLVLESTLKTLTKNLWVVHLGFSPEAGESTPCALQHPWPVPVEFHLQPGSVPQSGSEVRILRVTPLWLEAVTRCWSHHQTWIPHLGLLVVDLHLLEDRRVGFFLDSSVSRLRRINPLLQTLAVSLGAEHLAPCAHWLNARVLGGSASPIEPQRKGGLSPLCHHLEEWVLSEVASSSACTFDGLSRAHLKTLDGVEGPAVEDLHLALQGLMSKGLLHKVGRSFRVTALGQRLVWQEVA